MDQISFAPHFMSHFSHFVMSIKNYHCKFITNPFGGTANVSQDFHHKFIYASKLQANYLQET